MIHCHQVLKTYDAPADGTMLRWRLDDLHIEKGERVLVAGPSGCGKTTLLNLLSGLIRPDGGEIIINGMRIDSLSTAEIDVFRGQHLGLVFQSFHLLSPLTVMENLLLGARYGRKLAAHDAHVRAKALLAQVGLAKRLGHRPAQLSIGEQQRVAIARALMNEPPLLLADEPTASLDAANSAIVLDLLFQLCTEHGTTLVAVSHDTGIADRFDRRIDAAPWMQRAQEVAHV